MNASKVRVLIIDDSAVVRSILKGSLSQHPSIEVVGQAADGIEGLKQIKALRPDVCTLDVEMPRMNGLEVLNRVGGKLPVAFVMCSTLTQAGAQTTLEALQKGAFDYVAKPQQGGFAGDARFRRELHEKVLAAARAKGRTRKLLRATASGSEGASAGLRRLPPNKARGWIVAIGISCGGPQTLYEMLPVFPSDFVPIVITQHMPAAFTGSFAKHLDQLCAMDVCEGQDGMPIEHGKIYIAPGSHHMEIIRRGMGLGLKLDDGPEVSGHRPSVDVMFSSLARTCPTRCVAIIMTGMGRDGTAGMQILRRAGARTIAQDEATSLVYGMPKAAVAAGCVERSVPLSDIPKVAAELVQGPAPVAS